MNKTAIKNFAVWARRKLISEITYKAGLIGINENSILQPLPISTDNVQFFDIGTGKPTEISDHEIKQRNAIISCIKEKESTSDYKTAFQFVIEEVAYTWFNRLVAIRFMEVNDYLPSRIRVLSSDAHGKSEPDMVTTPFDTDMDLSAYETDRIVQLKDENKLDELFRMLFVKQCNKLNEVLPELFEKTLDYTEFLLTISFTDKEGIVSHLINDITEEDFTEAVEIIGWLYQYYNTEPKEEVFALLKKNVKITKERIPAATQLFTPDWIVRYMVENSLGRIFIENKVKSLEFNEEERKNKEKEIAEKMGWKYYLSEAEQTAEVREQLNSEFSKLHTNFDVVDIKIIDPCMGSGHILVYAFDLLMQIYESQGYTQRDAAQAIIENNLYGLDIDDRAYQLAYFAVMMKARKYDRRFLTKGIAPKLYSIQESNNINVESLKWSDNCKKTFEYLINTFADAKEYGSILNIEQKNYDELLFALCDFEKYHEITIENKLIEAKLPLIRNLINQAKVMAEKYDVVITNPPYMGGSGMNKQVSDYVKRNYPDSKSDLFAVLIEKCSQMTKRNFYTAMITQHAFMFLSSYEKLRSKLLLSDFVNMAHLGARAFEEIGGEVVQTTSFVMRKSDIKNYKSAFKRLVNYKSQQEKENEFLTKNDLYIAVKENFSKIPGSPIAYWVGEKIVLMFENPKLCELCETRKGLATSDNNRFLKFWFEVSTKNIDYNCNSNDESKNNVQKWYPLNKGGEFKRWYGNNEYVINWENDGFEIRNFRDSGGKLLSRPQNLRYNFKQSITWTKITSALFSARLCYGNFLFDDAAAICHHNDIHTLEYIIGFLNSKCCQIAVKILNPTMNIQIGDVGNLPIIIMHKNEVITLTRECLTIAKTDWDFFETSWDFVKHPLLKFRQYNALWGEPKEDEAQEFRDNGSICLSFKAWENFAEQQFNQLKANEEELNRIFIDIYGLQGELTPEVEDKDVTVRKADLQRDIKSFISYAVGCMFGRYSLNKETLVFAGGDFDKVFSKYKGQAALDEKGNPIGGGYAGISLSDYHYPKFRDNDNWENATELIFKPDYDNVIPITDEEYFKDDIAGLFVAFVKKVYGTETLEDNLDFIAKALGNKGDTSREIIRNYFIKDFFKDHAKIYQKRPIYWLYDSGKQNSFKALIYMHRYTADTTGIVRVDYLHKMQKIYKSEIDSMQEMADNSNNAREVAQAEKRKEKLVKQLKETKEYDEKIAHIALSRIDIDLDDGVKFNYEKIQTGHDGKKLDILGKI